MPFLTEFVNSHPRAPPSVCARQGEHHNHAVFQCNEYDARQHHVFVADFFGQQCMDGIWEIMMLIGIVCWGLAIADQWKWSEWYFKWLSVIYFLHNHENTITSCSSHEHQGCWLKRYLPVALLLSALPISELYKCSEPLSLAWNWRTWSENALIVIENAFFKSFIYWTLEKLQYIYSTLEKLQTEMEKDWDKIEESMMFSINEICYLSLQIPHREIYL